jgi:hypothetical protein
METLINILEQPETQAGATQLIKIMKSLGHPITMGCLCKKINITRVYEAAKAFVENNG